ncbi:MAG: alpha/beta hydrolase [Caulobacteraceae bacterium]|nr:alpha/beta hydrolase [Caulobacter sp.]
MRPPALCAALGLALAPMSAGAQGFKPMTWAQFYARPAPRADARVAYGAGPDGFGELWLPPGAGPHPLVVLIHGGCWTKSVADLHIMSPAAADLRRRGVAVWNIEYRGVDGTGGGYPGTYQDVAAGLDALRRIAPEHHLRLDRVVVAGHSAGGQLALWAAARRRIVHGPLAAHDPLKVAAVVDISGLPNLETDRRTACGAEPVDAMAGPERPGGRFADTSPAQMLPLGVRQEVVVGAEDHTVSPVVSEAYVARAKAAGDPVTLHVVPDSAHVEEITPGAPGWDAAAALIVELSR